MKNIRTVFRRAFLSLWVLFIPQLGTALERPNIILLLTDDMGYGDISAHGNPLIQTPNFDRLHRESLRFTDFVVSPTCAPTRCALMTGKHEFKSGVTHTTNGRNLMDLDVEILPQVLKKAGYKTAMFGKWHLGLTGDHVPYRRGFDETLNNVDDTQKAHYNPTLLRNGNPEKFKGYRTDIFFNEAMKYIERQKKGEPFFCYIATNSPHTPLKVPKAYSQPFEGKSAKPEFHGMVSNLDENLGKLLDKLKSLNMEDNTLFIAMNDNGATYGADVWNAGMRGVKVNAYYGAIKAYSFWRWPKVISPGERDQLTAHYDIFPTLASIAGTPLSDTYRKTNDMDGFDLSPLLKQDLKKWSGEDRMIIHHSGRWETGSAARHQYAFCGVRYKKFHMLRQHPCLQPDCGQTERAAICKLHRVYMKHPDQPGYYADRQHYKYTEPEKWAMFNLEKDLHQDHDISEKIPELTQHLTAAYDQWWSRLPLKH